MNKFKSHWYYWHTEHKGIAITSMIASAMVMWFFLVVGAGFSFWSVVIAILLDAVGFWLAIIYFFALRDYIPGFLDFQAKADGLVLDQIIIPIIITFFVSRLISFFVAKKFGYKFPDKAQQPKDLEVGESTKENEKSPVVAESQSTSDVAATASKIKMQQALNDEVARRKAQGGSLTGEQDSVKPMSDEDYQKALNTAASERMTNSETLFSIFLVIFSIVGFFNAWWIGIVFMLLAVFYVASKMEYYKQQIISGNANKKRITLTTNP